MKRPMQILIAYDGSDGADAALRDLTRAGLPPDAEAWVLTVADASTFGPRGGAALFASGDEETLAGRQRARAAAILHRARTAAADGSKRVASLFPGWRVRTQVTGGAPASAIVFKADIVRPDLVVVGSRMRSRPARLLLGSVARKVVTESLVTVRVARAPVARDGAPLRILVGHDGAGGGQAALHAAAGRAWPEGSEIRAVAVQDADVWSVLGPEFESEAAWPPAEMPMGREMLRRVIEQDLEALARPGLTVSAEVESGVASRVLLRVARSWKADSVFVGATRRGPIERFLLGNVASAVADRARCSVEVVRARPE